MQPPPTPSESVRVGFSLFSRMKEALTPMKSTPSGKKVAVGNAGANRAQQRASAKQRKKSDSKKPMFMRVLVLAMVAVMFLGYFLMIFLR